MHGCSFWELFFLHVNLCYWHSSFVLYNNGPFWGIVVKYVVKPFTSAMGI